MFVVAMSLDAEARWGAEWQRGCQAHPRVALSLADFAAHAEGATGGAGPPLAHADDLFLACACALAIPAALAAFDRLLADVPAWVRHVEASPDLADEVSQRLRERLLVAPAGGRPRIVEYNGAGPLRAWLRVAAARTALNLRRNRGDRPMAPLEFVDQEGPALFAAGAEPELHVLRGAHQDTLREAMRDAFVWLSQEERTVLRLQYSARMTTEQIATALRLHRATVVRRLSQARTRMLGETRRLLSERLRLSGAETDALIDALRDDLDLSLTSLLQTVSEPGPRPGGSPET
jgi:RNA polymerase sigma-70 factor, ECF subfamily